MTEYQLAAMERAGEHGEPIFRAPSVGCSGTDEDQIYTLDRAADLLEGYAEFIRSDVMSADIERHPYLPEIDGTAEDLRALSRAATGETS
jgi:hypothetical protein